MYTPYINYYLYIKHIYELTAINCKKILAIFVLYKNIYFEIIIYILILLYRGEL